MTIRTKISLLFTAITGFILFIFVTYIYQSAKNDREKEYYSVLEHEAITKASLFLDNGFNEKILQDIYHNNRKIINEVQVSVYDTNFRLLYHDATDIDIVKETHNMIRETYRKKILKFYQNDWQVVSILYPFKGKNYIIFATAYDQHGFNKLQNMLQNSVIAFVLAVIITYLAGIFFSRKVFKQVNEMTEQVNVITATNLDLRLVTNDVKDELTELAGTFNQMLDRLESSFESQKNFVSNIAHELRTPLAAIITELDLAVSRKRSEEEYISAIQNTLADARKLARLSTSLLDLAKANYDPSEITFKPVRIDEVLLDALQDVQKINPEYAIHLNVESKFDSDEEMTCSGNEYLLKVAFVNLMENACKFSADHQAYVAINSQNNQLRIIFTDYGCGIPAEDLNLIFEPFFRGTNQNKASGNGIGLSLTKKIITLHNGIITVDSILNNITTFTVILQNN